MKKKRFILSMDTQLIKIFDQFCYIHNKNRNEIVKKLLLSFLKKEMPDLLQKTWEQKQELEVIKDILYDR